MNYMELVEEINKRMYFYESLMERARRMADIVNSKFISDEEAAEYMREGYRALYDKIIGTSCDWAVKSFVPEAGDVEEVSDGERVYWEIKTPEDFYKLRGISVRNGGVRADLKPYPKLEEYTHSQTAYRMTAGNKIRIINPRTAQKDSLLIEYFPPPFVIGTEPSEFEKYNASISVEGATDAFNTYFISGDWLVYGIAKKVMFYSNYNSGFRVVDLTTAFTGEPKLTQYYDYYPNGDKKNEICLFVGADDNWIYFLESTDGATLCLCRTQSKTPFREIETVSNGWNPVAFGYGKGTVYGIKTDDNVNVRVVKFDGTAETVVYEYQHESGNMDFIVPFPDLWVNAVGIVDWYVNETADKVKAKEGIHFDIRDLWSNYYLFNNRLYTESSIVSFDAETMTYRVTEEGLSARTTPTEIKDDGKEKYSLLGGYSNGKINILKNFEPPAIAPNLNATSDYLVYYMVVCFLDKQGKDSSRFQVKLAEIEQRLIRELDVDEHRPQTVGNDFKRGSFGWWL